MKGPGEARVVVGMKGLEDFIPKKEKQRREKTRLSGNNEQTKKPPTGRPTDLEVLERR